MPGEIYVTHIPVRFQHCDPAGIVFYPRYFEFTNQVVETWCEKGLGLSFAEMHLKQNLGIPTVHVDTNFRLPSQLGDMLEARLVVTDLGGASFGLQISLGRETEEGWQERVLVRLRLVTMDLGKRKAVPIPPSLRDSMQRYLTLDTQTTTK